MVSAFYLFRAFFLDSRHSIVSRIGTEGDYGVPEVSVLSPFLSFSLAAADSSSPSWFLFLRVIRVASFVLTRCSRMLVGEKKLGKVIVPDKWKEGASNTTESGGRKINENKLLSKKNRFVSQYGLSSPQMQCSFAVTLLFFLPIIVTTLSSIFSTLLIIPLF